jgi:hypothetical protein
MMQAKAIGKAAAMDRCELCGVKAPATFVGRTRHLRQEHPAYARGLLLRIVSPMIFLAFFVVLQAAEAPAWTILPAAAAAGGLALAGLWTTRKARTEAGTAYSLGKLFKEGGYRFVLMAAVFAALLILAATQR